MHTSVLFINQIDFKRKSFKAICVFYLQNAKLSWFSLLLLILTFLLSLKSKAHSLSPSELDLTKHSCTVFCVDLKKKMYVGCALMYMIAGFFGCVCVTTCLFIVHFKKQQREALRSILILFRSVKKEIRLLSPMQQHVSHVLLLIWVIL